jgi:allantoinase
MAGRPVAAACCCPVRRTEWEGFVTATRAAAAGGVTSLVDMRLNSVPPTVDVSALHVKREVVEGQVAVDVAF